MSDLGLGNLIELKRHLLSPENVTESTWDDVITDLGQGVAKQFDQACNRLLGYNAAHVDEFSADRGHWVTRAYPIVSIASVEIRDDYGASWVSQTLADVISALDDETGIVNFGTPLGSRIARARITYAGGFWYDTTEDFSGTQPAGSTARQSDLKLAWLLQCREAWAHMDVIGSGLIDRDKVLTALAEFDFVPLVKNALRGYQRFMIS